MEPLANNIRPRRVSLSQPLPPPRHPTLSSELDLQWYGKDGKPVDASQAIDDELEELRQQEADALAEALGAGPIRRKRKDEVSKQELNSIIKKDVAEALADGEDESGLTGLGFQKSGTMRIRADRSASPSDGGEEDLSAFFSGAKPGSLPEKSEPSNPPRSSALAAPAPSDMRSRDAAELKKAEKAAKKAAKKAKKEKKKEKKEKKREKRGHGKDGSDKSSGDERRVGERSRSTEERRDRGPRDDRSPLDRGPRDDRRGDDRRVREERSRSRDEPRKRRHRSRSRSVEDEGRHKRHAGSRSPDRRRDDSRRADDRRDRERDFGHRARGGRDDERRR
ncbi:hypothetical protein BDK51DRAFT_37566 [Blyttiomyces helicus]|uniref:Uncharacterized protein n=1 Tax=Blyttiomyces helicus TaxID=388810 RepID=A0A4P9VZF7_9FUNG|nr:hypothetical protein BDK51DRAFT_37566 [Blyttiomyces helicus]|eukprot:RKO84173.1 hypothetical protein BDK51DRAFT_37566 [Blyttiomyces helicus]